MDFEPINGKYLAYPDKNAVVLLNTDDWSQTSTLSCNEVSSSYSIVQYSPCGKYILATTEEGDFVLWQVFSETVMNISKHQKSIAICGLMWNPKGNINTQKSFMLSAVIIALESCCNITFITVHNKAFLVIL
ncbi:hypothetical protein NQ314_015168 [Rhamnusium bicolor]|uniref:Uncharacterized protein n=1 Tax=Rhamnusium bicolor TaxID=1586634 RepID=A0AAV8WYV7_9CUCU|nr:hypothetical protein NQ314_015168 [Rhamnusium bicolor]